MNALKKKFSLLIGFPHDGSEMLILGQADKASKLLPAFGEIDPKEISFAAIIKDISPASVFKKKNFSKPSIIPTVAEVIAAGYSEEVAKAIVAEQMAKHAAKTSTNAPTNSAGKPPAS